MAKTILYVNLFFGGATNWPVLIVKVFLLYMWPVFIGVAFPRFRVDQSIRWFLRIPALIGILAILFI
jgi:NADH-quinone oxidoreductase subunit H